MGQFRLKATGAKQLKKIVARIGQVEHNHRLFAQLFKSNRAQLARRI